MSKPETVKLWTERLRRFDLAGTTVAAFCTAEGVSQPSYLLLATQTGSGVRLRITATIREGWRR